MELADQRAGAERGANARFFVGLARAAAGAIIFSLPVLMTMEMWQLGFGMQRTRLALFLVASFPLLVGLSWVSGFEETFELVQDVVDALVALAVGFATSALFLGLFSVVERGMPTHEVVGKIALLAVPGSIGALLAQSQLGGRSDESQSEPRTHGPTGHGSQLFIMAVGALFLAFNIAPTDEVVVIAHKLERTRLLPVMAISLVAMHGFVYAVEFRGQERVPRGTPWWSVFLRSTISGYALALVVCGCVLWTFGRLDGASARQAIAMIVVLGLPAAIGAAAARLIL